MQITEIFADDAMVDFVNQRGRAFGGRKVSQKLLEIALIIAQRVLGGVANGAEILHKFCDRGFYGRTGTAGVRLVLRAVKGLAGLFARERHGFAGISAPTVTGANSSGAAISQSQPSFKQARTTPVLVRFSTMNGAPHFGQGSALGRCAVVKSH